MNRHVETFHKGDRKENWRSTTAMGGRTLTAASHKRLYGYISAPPPPSRDLPENTSWLQAWTALKKHWRLSAVFAASVMTAVLLVTVLTKPVYEPTARVEIDPPGAELFTMEGRGGSDGGTDYLETQARNLKSDELFITVTQQLHLDEVPEFTQPGLTSRMVSAVFSTIEGIPRLLWSSKKAQSTTTGSTGAPVLTAKQVSVLHALQSQVSVKRDTASRLISVSFASHDPVLSANVTNQIVRSFIERTYQTRHAAIMESTEWLSRQLDDIRAKMEQSNRELADFQRQSGIADIDQNKSTFTEQMTELSRQKTQAQAERIQIESYLRNRSRGSNTLPQIQSNQVVQLLTQRLGEARAELAQALAIYGKNHPNAKKLQNQVEELESQILLQQNAIVGQLQTSYTAALARERLIDAQMRGTARELGEMSRYTSLKKDAEANADLYNTLYARVKEAGITAASKSINIRIVDQARVLDSPTRPRPLMNLSVGLFVALAGGLLLAFIREALDTRINTLEDIRQFTGMSAISMVPIADERKHAALWGPDGLILTGPRQVSLDGPAKFLLEQPGSEQSEALRGIHTSVMLSRREQPPRVLLVASSMPGEGKSTVAINLAVAFAQQGKTCILDADLRRPSVAKAFGIPETVGLSNYLLDSAPLESILTPAPQIDTLTILAAGKALPDAAKFINTENMRTLVRELRRMFDFLVIDSSPILPYAEGRTLSTLVDGVVFVGRAGAITREALLRSMELLQEVHSAPILEVVLNGAALTSTGYGYHYNYKYPEQT